MSNHEEKLLKLWKARQEAEGKDVSNVKTLKEAEAFYKKKPTKAAATKKPDKGAK